MKKIDLSLYFITDSTNLSEDNIIVSLLLSDLTVPAIIGTTDIAIGDIRDGVRLNNGTAIFP